MAIAKAICTCKICGEKFAIQVTKRNRAEADSFEAWAAENIDVCRECERKAEFEHAKQETESLPELTGSEKQIAWATKIRADFFRQVRQKMEETEAAGKTVGENYKRVVEEITGRTSSSWWIDNRVYSARVLIGKVWEEMNGVKA